MHLLLQIATVGLPLVLAGCSRPAIEGRWDCGDEIRAFDADGTYRIDEGDGGFAHGMFRREGDLLITKLDRVRQRIAPADRALTAQMLAVTGNHEGLAELSRTGLITMDTPSAGEFGYRIDALETGRLELTHAFFPGRNGERREPRVPSKTRCERLRA